MVAKAIIFDKDGTLFPYSIWSKPIRKFLLKEMPLAKLDEKKKEECIDEFSRVIGFEKDGTIIKSGLFLKRNYLSSFFSLVRITLKYHLNPFKSSIGFLKIKNRCRYGYKEELESHDFTTLKRILRDLIESGSNIAIFTNDTKESLDIFLSVFGREYFSFSVDHSSLHTKPDPRTIKDFSIFSGISPKEMMMVSDNTKDLKMAKKAGVGTIVAILGTRERKELEEWADYIFPDVTTALSFFIA
ncbi:MAG: HAD family hydrolase [Candidatus Ornithospirochaeta sp.]